MTHFVYTCPRHGEVEPADHMNGDINEPVCPVCGHGLDWKEKPWT